MVFWSWSLKADIVFASTYHLEGVSGQASSDAVEQEEGCRGLQRHWERVLFPASLFSYPMYFHTPFGGKKRNQLALQENSALLKQLNSSKLCHVWPKLWNHKSNQGRGGRGDVEVWRTSWPKPLEFTSTCIDHWWVLGEGAWLLVHRPIKAAFCYSCGFLLAFGL